MNLIIYPLLSPRSQKAFRRQWKAKGKFYGNAVWKKYQYTPRRNLVRRLSITLNMSERQVREQIEKERIFVLKNSQYYR